MFFKKPKNQKMSDFLQTVRTVKEKLRNLFPETPCQYSPYLSEKYNAKIYLKREDLTPVRSYKIRGAFNAMSNLKETQKQQSVVCASAGNHAQGFAYACQHFQIKGTVFMPITTPKQKIIKTEVIGKDFVKIKLIGDTFDESSKFAQEFCKTEKATFIPPFDDEKVIEGQATVGLEILEQMQETDLSMDKILIPVGGGGLSSGISELFETEAPEIEIHCVEAQGAPTLKKSLENKKITTLEKIDTFADGTAVKTIGTKNFERLQKYIKNPVQLVPEDRLCTTIMDFLFHEGIVLEPSGGIAIDALKNFKASEIKGQTIVCIVSGGNFDFERLPDVKERSLLYEGVKKYLLIKFPQRPGALKEFLELMGPEDDIARFEYLKKSARNFESVLLGVETSKPENLEILLKKMEKEGLEYEEIERNSTLFEVLI